MPTFIGAEVVTHDPELALVAGRCVECGTTTFPAPEGCPRCTASDLEQITLPRRGELWSWTVQRFEPKPPYRGAQPFAPYGVGYVSFPGLCVVEGRLTTADPEDLEIGMEMELVSQVLAHAAGEDLVTYAFAPVAGGAR
jgi:uncharacterized OB-fold protein